MHHLYQCSLHQQMIFRYIHTAHYREVFSVLLSQILRLAALLLNGLPIQAEILHRDLNLIELTQFIAQNN